MQQVRKKILENSVPLLENLNKDSQKIEIVKKIKIEHPECNRKIRDRKVSLSKKTEKTYKVTVTYIQVTEEEARIKRALIESIIKKCHRGKS